MRLVQQQQAILKNWASQTNKKPVETVSNTGEVVKRLAPEQYAYHFMKKREWLRLQAYHDWGRQRSIGYGTHSYAWELITYEEANKRYRDAIKPRAEKVKSENPDKNSCQLWALISLYYNCPSCYRTIVKNPTRKSFLAHSSVCVDWKCKVWKWLQKRRSAERELYTMCDGDR